MISHNRPLISSEDRGAVDAVLASGWIAQGPSVAALETSFVRYHASGGACAVSNGTASLFLALKALGAGAGSEVAVPSYACSALLNAVFMIGALPKVVDVLPDTFCMDPRARPKLPMRASFLLSTPMVPWRMLRRSKNKIKW
jgi:perosamine synthetase